MSSHKESEHHVIPKSRGGKRTCILPENFHEAWHQIFSNMTPQEICKFVKIIQAQMINKNEITWSDINALRNKLKGG